jgi:hypothetical protein
MSLISTTLNNKTGNARKLNNEARSRNHVCREKAISITYFECVSVTLIIQHAKRLRYIVIRVLPGFAVFFYIHFYTILEKKKVIEYEICFDFPYNYCLKHFPF